MRLSASPPPSPQLAAGELICCTAVVVFFAQGAVQYWAEKARQMCENGNIRLAFAVNPMSNFLCTAGAVKINCFGWGDVSGCPFITRLESYDVCLFLVKPFCCQRGPRWFYLPGRCMSSGFSWRFRRQANRHRSPGGALKQESLH